MLSPREYRRAYANAVTVPRSDVDFANVLFAGPCNRACYYCIGRQLPDRVNAPNLRAFPPGGLDAFIEACNRLRVRQIVFTGTTSDPQMYAHEAELLGLLRERLDPGAQFSVHTNGVLALRKLEVFNQYDRACVSIPSFDPDIYQLHTGSARVPDLAGIVSASRIPVKVSCVLDEHNAGDIVPFLRRCREIGIARVVFRKLYGDTREWPVPDALQPRGLYHGNRVYDSGGVEVTFWDFDVATSTSLNLFADGTLGSSYLLADTSE